MSTISLQLTIGGRLYKLASPAGQETRLKALAARVDALLNELKLADPTTDRDRQLVLTCLQLSADLADAHQKLDEQAVAVTHFHRQLCQRLEEMLPATSAAH